MKLGQRKVRWTLGGLMLLIALGSLPLAWYVHMARMVDRQRAAAEAQRSLAVEQLKQLGLALRNYHANFPQNQAPPKAQAKGAEESSPGGTPPPAVGVEPPK